MRSPPKGFLASSLSFLLWLPQAALVWRARADPDQLAAISISTQVLLVANCALWGAYAVLVGAFWVGAPGLVNAPLAPMTIAVIHRAGHTSAGRAAHPAGPPKVAHCPVGG